MCALFYIFIIRCIWFAVCTARLYCACDTLPVFKSSCIFWFGSPLKVCFNWLSCVIKPFKPFWFICVNNGFTLSFPPLPNRLFHPLKPLNHPWWHILCPAYFPCLVGANSGLYPHVWYNQGSLLTAYRLHRLI